MLLSVSSASPAATPTADRIRVDSGFAVDVYARGLVRPTAMAFGPDGRLYVTQEAGSVVSAIAGTQSPRPFARGFAESTLGLAWLGKTLFVSTKGRVERLRIVRGQVAGRRTVLRGLPNRLHQQDNVVVLGGRLFLGIGSTCDACEETDPRSATVASFEPDGSDFRIESRGVRNPYGLAVEPGSGRLYASVNGRDRIGRSEPAEMVVRVRRGANFGWPACWPSWRLRRLVGTCDGVTAPVAYLEPHSSADGLAFAPRSGLPARYRGNLFVAEWGQYNSRTWGRKIVRIALGPDGSARSVSTFADGFDHPLALVFDRAGALLVADWGRGVIYRIRSRGT